MYVQVMEFVVLLMYVPHVYQILHGLVLNVKFQNVLEYLQMTPRMYVLDVVLVLLQTFVLVVEQVMVDPIVNAQFAMDSWQMTQSTYVRDEVHV